MAGGSDCTPQLMMENDEACEPKISWFVGYTGELIGEVNDKMMNSKDCKKRYKTTDFRIQADWDPVPNELYVESDAFLTGFHFTVGRLNIKAVGLEGETIGYQEVLTPNANVSSVSLDVSQFYEGSSYWYEAGSSATEANFEMNCPDHTFVDEIGVEFSEVM